MAENRTRINVMVDPATAERLRDAAAAGEGETISSIVEAGALAYVEKLEVKRGRPFEQRTGDVPTGRPRKPSIQTPC